MGILDSQEDRAAKGEADLKWYAERYSAHIDLVQRMMARLADLLEADHFNNIEAMVLDAGVPYPKEYESDKDSQPKHERFTVDHIDIPERRPANKSHICPNCCCLPCSCLQEKNNG
jgi:hypothetical protein